MPCALRSQTLHAVGDIPVRELLVFVPDGQELPQPTGWRHQPKYAGAANLPVHIEITSPAEQASEWDRVREQLSLEAEQRGAT